MKKTRRAKIQVKTKKARRVSIAEFEALNRSRRAINGWVTRRRRERRERREELQREREREEKRRKKKLPPKKKKSPPKRKTGERPEHRPVRDYVVTMSYRDKRGHTRTVDFVSSAESRDAAIEQVQEDHPWTQRIPWKKIIVAEGPESNQDAGTVRERLVNVKRSKSAKGRRTSKSSRRNRTRSKLTSTVRKR